MNTERAGGVAGGMLQVTELGSEGWALCPDRAGALLTLRLASDPQCGRGWQKFSGNWAPRFQFGCLQFCDLDPAPFFSKLWFLDRSDEDEKSFPESVADGKLNTGAVQLGQPGSCMVPVTTASASSHPQKARAHL